MTRKIILKEKTEFILAAIKVKEKLKEKMKKTFENKMKRKI